MTEARPAHDAPELVSQLLRDILLRLDDGSKTMSQMKEEIAGLRFETARLKEQVTFANGRTGKLEGKLEQILHEELPGLRGAFNARVEEVEGNLEALLQQRAVEAARREARRELRAEDRARLRYFWDVVDHPVTKFVLGGVFLGLTVLLGRLVPWLG